LGVERLHQTHDSLRAFRPIEGVQAILGPGEPPPSGIIVPAVAPRFDETPGMLASDPFTYEAYLAPQTPLWAPQIAVDSGIDAPVCGFVEFLKPQPKWPTDRLEIPAPNPLAATGKIRIPLRAVAVLLADVQAAGSTKIPVEARDSKGASRVEALAMTTLPCREMERSVAPQGFPQAPAEAEEDLVPFSKKLMALAAFAASEDAEKKSRRDPWPAAPFPNMPRAPLNLGTSEFSVVAVSPNLAGLRPLSIDQVPLVHGTWIDNLRAMGIEGESPRYELATPALRPRLRLAAGSRYPVATKDTATAVAVIEPESVVLASAVSIPARKVMTAAAGVSTSGQKAAELAPGSAGLLPLACAKANEPQPAQTVQTVSLPQPLWSGPVRPESHLEPLDAKPVMDIMKPEAPVEAPAALKTAAINKDEPAKKGGIEALIPPEAKDSTGATAWMHVTGFWQHAPRDLKLLLFGIPILLALALQPRLKKVPFTAPPQAAGIERNFQTKLNEQFKNVRQQMVDRAAIALDEDFRAGLDDWTSRGGTTDWAFDATGFVRPGPLALYRPSVDLTDYQLQFLGLIDKKALSWVVRAADFDDYYVVKLVVLKPGPVPTIGVTRYAVIHGVAQNRADTTAFINAREDMLYRVRMDIHGDSFALTVQGQMVDSWSEPRLRTGGVGFFTARGEASRLRWVQVTHQYDMLGRLCAYLAPYNIPSTNGGWQP
jgi:hypothetical protein